MKRPDAKRQAIGMVELGIASRVTRGLAYYLPWYEVGVPPYIYACPYC